MGKHTPIDYAGLNHALLQRVDSLLARWLPQGEERSGRWYVGDFDGSPGESANVNMSTGQWIDNGGGEGDKGGDLVSLYARIHGLSNHQAAVELMAELGWSRPGDDEHVQAPAPQRAKLAPASEGGAVPPSEPRPRKREQKWRAVVPVPAFAPKPDFVFGYKDKSKPGAPWVELDATRTWEYRFGDKLFGYVARFERVNSEGELVKDTVARTWCQNLEDGSGSMRWHWKQWEAPRPLYVPASLLSEGAALPVVLVEGEKCAEAGHQLLGHEFDFVSWPGGCKAWAMADWSWLQGRTVIMWPDCDAQRERLTKEAEALGTAADQMPYKPEAKQPGMQAMVKIGTELLAKHECAVMMCAIPKPGAKPGGWDIADAIAEGWDAAKVRDFLRGAFIFVPPNDEARAMATAADPGAAAGEDESGEPITWRKALIYSLTGAIKACRENAVLAVDGMGLPDGRWLPGAVEAQGVIAFDEFSNNVIKLKPTPWGTSAGVWQEEDELEMGHWLTRAYYLPPMPRGTLEEAVLMVAKRHKVHPAREGIEALRGQWDGIKRIGSWLRTVCMEEDEIDAGLQDYLARAGAWFLMAMCARVLPELRERGEIVRGPGTKFDYMLIFEGPQGWGKSTIARVLGGEYYADTGLQLGEKDSYQNIQGIHVYEWGELDSMSKADVKLVKLFIASAKDRFRATFDRRPRDYPRQVVFVGTTNEDHYLSDPTGNRRFWPVRLTRPANLAWLREHREQLLAEALHHVENGARFHPTIKEQRDMFDPQQQLRMVENSIETLIKNYLFDEQQTVPLNGVNGTLVDLIGLTELLSRIGYAAEKQTQVVMKQAASVMGRLGWQLKKMGKDGDGHRPYKYVRPPRRASSGIGQQDQSSPTQGTHTAGTTDGCPF
jgi:predicted P-loop ATPase